MVILCLCRSMNNARAHTSPPNICTVYTRLPYIGRGIAHKLVEKEKKKSLKYCYKLCFMNMVIIYLQRQRMKRAKRKNEKGKNGKMNMTLGKKVHVLAYLHPTRPKCCSITTTTTTTTMATAESTSIKKEENENTSKFGVCRETNGLWHLGDSVICCVC